MGLGFGRQRNTKGGGEECRRETCQMAITKDGVDEVMKIGNHKGSRKNLLTSGTENESQKDQA
jgi:hypothetical protein